MCNNIDSNKIDLNSEPPLDEPARQFYFMEKCRGYVSGLKERLGRSPSFFIQTFGCQMNFHDSEKIVAILERIGFVEAEGENADFVLYNTCTVRENANERVYGRLGQLKRVKKNNPEMIIGICGCMMQEEHVIEKIRKSYKFVDIVFGTHNIFKFAELLYARLRSGEQIIDIWKEADRIVEELPVDRKYDFKCGVNIMYGCNNFCSYCIVPYVRGRERSRTPDDIISEIRRLVDDGVIEIMLLGQNVNSYGKNLDTEITFAKLLKEIEKIDGLERIRFMTSHPKDLSDELIEVMAASKKICRHIHLPLQSGSSRILKKMNRRYTKEQYLELVDKIKKAMPDISITTDLIVGFPGETDEDVDETIDVVKKVGYDSAFTFQYSRRTGTPAASMENQVPKEAVTRNFDRLLKTVQEVAAKRTARFEGQTMSVLVEEVDSHEEGMLTGRLGNNTVVHFDGGRDLIGSIVDVRLDECRGFYYIGRQVNINK
ncbi:MAG: tRNA (N6-isopentenyl adenosine(37)-C2)-methylthiotransferase MiaB [Lachnospiraceae bacterium]|nr:tRNA (N6-isopentenyl adenosine(37)-C2)-methylthiotransferase MiaB [Lachnospiraceae bacterium]